MAEIKGRSYGMSADVQRKVQLKLFCTLICFDWFCKRDWTHKESLNGLQFAVKEKIILSENSYPHSLENLLIHWFARSKASLFLEMLKNAI